MANPVILREDFYRRTDLTGHDLPKVFGAAAGFPESRLRDNKDFLFWKADLAGTHDYTVDLGAGNDLAPTAIAILAHNLNTTSSSWELAFSDDDIAYTDVISAFAPTDDKIQFRTFITTAHQFWRIRITSATTSTIIGEILLGRTIDFPHSIDPFVGFDPIAEQPSNRMTRSEDGHIVKVTSDFVARSQEWRFRLESFSDFVDDTTAFTGFRKWWDEFGALKIPSVFSWNPGNPGSFEADTMWAVVQGTLERPLANQLDVGDRDVLFQITGLKEC